MLNEFYAMLCFSHKKVFYFNFIIFSDVKAKLHTLREWHNSGKKPNNHAGCLLIGYEAYRTLVTYHVSKTSIKLYESHFLDGVKKKVKEYLLDPGNLSR